MTDFVPGDRVYTNADLNNLVEGTTYAPDDGSGVVVKTSVRPNGDSVFLDQAASTIYSTFPDGRAPEPSLPGTVLTVPRRIEPTTVTVTIPAYDRVDSTGEIHYGLVSALPGSDVYYGGPRKMPPEKAREVAAQLLAGADQIDAGGAQ